MPAELLWLNNVLTWQALMQSWARLARSKQHDAAFLQASLLFVVRAFAAGDLLPANQAQLAMDLAQAAAAAAAAGNGNRCCSI